MEWSSDDQDSVPDQLTRGRQAVEPQSTNQAGFIPKLGRQIQKDLQWSSNSERGLGREQGHDLVVKQPRFSGLQKYVTFYRLHVTYFLTLGSLGALCIYVLPLSNCRRLSFVDAIYTSFSAVCGTGLQTVRSGDLTKFHNIVILLLMNLGAPVLVSLLPLQFRRFYFLLCIKQFSQDPHGYQGKHVAVTKGGKLHNNYDGKIELELKHMEPPSPCDEEYSQDGVVVLSTEFEVRDIEENNHMGHNVYLKDLGGNWRMYVDAKQALRTLEYKALIALSRVVACFFFGAQIIGFSLGAIYFSGSTDDANIAKRMDINPTFFAFFTAISTFTNGGYNLNNDGMLIFQNSTFLLILYTILASIGNTMYAPFLRLLVWICYHLAGEKDKAVYEYLLRHPRRCFTNLFPKSQTIWLVVTFVAFTSLQLIFLCKLEWNQALGGITSFKKLIVGVYQTVGTRNAGGNAISLYQIAPAVLFIFMVMMYISAYPNFLSLHTSNDDYDDVELQAPHAYKENINPNQWESILVVQSRRLLARDTSYLFFAVLFLCLSEKRSIKEDPLNFSIFNIVFEIISAYGSIGLSLGYHCDLQIGKARACEKVPYSFSGTWTSTGKLIVVLIMFLGRHRGLPDNIDSAIRLPTMPFASTLSQTPQRRCEEYVTEVELRMRPQLELAQRISPDFMRQWMAVKGISKPDI